MPESTQSNLSFLDVICCAMGGMVILAVIFSIIKNPIQIPVKNEFILIEATSKGGKEPMGVIITRNGARYAILPGDASEADLSEHCSSLNSWIATDGEATKLYLEIREPASGDWYFEIFRSDWQSDQKADADARLTLTRIDAWTKQGAYVFENVPNDNEASLNAPGSHSISYLITM